MCFSEKAPVVKHSAASDGLFSGKKTSKKTIMRIYKEIVVFMWFYEKLRQYYYITLDKANG